MDKIKVTNPFRKKDQPQLYKLIESIELILAQIRLMSSFVGDMLDLRLLKEGTLSISQEMFNPTKAIDFVLQMFKIKAAMFGTSLERKVMTTDERYGVITS